MVYTTHAAVAALLGVTLTPGQQTLITATLEPAMQAYIDRFTGRSWGAASPVTAELHTVYGGVVYLKQRPVTTITAASYRYGFIGSTPTALVVGTSIELLDASRGQVLVSAPDDSQLSVSYTHAGALPADIGLAATMLVAAHMGDVLLADPDLRGVKSYAFGSGDIQMSFDTQASATQAAAALDILKLRRVFVFS